MCVTYFSAEHEKISAAIRLQNQHLDEFKDFISGPNICTQAMLEPQKLQCVLFEQTFNLTDEEME